MSIMRVRFTITGLTGLPGLHTTYWTGASSTPVAADALDVVARVRAFWNTIKNNMAAGTTIAINQNVDVLDQVTGTLTGQLAPGTVTSVVGSGTSSLPSATMMLLKYQTSTIVNGRRLQGRSFIGPLSTLCNTAGDVTPANNALLLTGSNDLTTGPTASSLVVWHRPTDLLPAGGSTAPVVSFATNTEFSVLRSRRD